MANKKETLANAFADNIQDCTPNGLVNAGRVLQQNLSNFDDDDVDEVAEKVAENLHNNGKVKDSRDAFDYLNKGIENERGRANGLRASISR